MPAHVISTHAVLRYVERVMGADLDEVRAAMRAADPQTTFADGVVLAFLERERKIVVAKVRELMMTPLVLAAIRAGANRVREGGWWFIIEDKTVVTVVPKQNVNTGGRRSKPKTQRGRRPEVRHEQDEF